MSPTGWYQASDGGWYATDVAPAPGWWLASDLRWYPPSGHPVGDVEPWMASRWGLGDCWWGFLAYVVASIAIGVVVVIASLATDDRPVDEIELGVYAVAISVLANVVAFAGVPWLASRRKGLGRLADDFGLRIRLLDVAIGFGFGFAALLVGGWVNVALDSLFGTDGETSNVPFERLTGAGEIIAFAVAVAVVTPVIEELFFRGLLRRSLLKRGTGRWATFAITSIVFVIPHLLSLPEWPNVIVLFAVISVFAVAFHLACDVTDGRLGAPIVAHMVTNGAAVVSLAFA
jgi:uncharacterized protein